ncbi:LysM peptidoglycan-binding domain-containing protein [Solihabitans fulvus]|uniref:LysM peptidoglycan-binding domain-containing protein n=1 Tax=Solihabitans fulvus TaxID=1892852 RepID=A0A5B2X6G6_9PSEU|nr:LysM peptidoglycan-binding domain-containing protein [Solihabitans fulvus]KAA2258795.1 LysM peptidoglycan-binding domain-containing protein [Solihabitans fulvus]
MSGGVVHAMLVSKTPTAPGVVKFGFNPQKISISRAADLTQRPSTSRNGGMPGGGHPNVVKGAKMSTISINEVMFRGNDIKLTCDQLLNWMTPGGGMLGAIAGAALSALSGGLINLATKPPLLMFSWGPPEIGFMYDVVISNCQIDYVRFNSQGIPIRANVNLKLLEQPSLLGTLPTNPTSGGLPGRRRHVVSEGESLQRIATEAYGNPQRWRWLAEANGIDDPARVRPGDVLLLPHPDERSPA